MNVKSHLAFPSRLPNQRDKIANFHSSTFSWMFSKVSIGSLCNVLLTQKVKAARNRQKLFMNFTSIHNPVAQMILIYYDC